MAGNTSREKGKRWEKKICHWFTSAGFRANRLLGRKGEPDVRVEIPEGWCLYLEAKHHKKVNLRQAVAQAKESSRGPNDHWAVCAKDDRNEEIWIFPKELAERFLVELLHTKPMEIDE